MYDFIKLFHIDNLSIIMMVLVGFVAISVASFSFRYMNGDSKKKSFFTNLSFLVIFLFLMACCDNIFLFAFLWICSNLLLSILMLHKKQWEAARQSYILAVKNFSLGGSCLAIAFLFLYFSTGETSIKVIINNEHDSFYSIIAGFLMLITAMTQCALWPFHSWLTSSLNSPTPVSAIMHAGLVNGGGFLLARFAPMIWAQPGLADLIFIVGILTAFIGTFWKLMQSDIKRTLACSTMAQMGFMISQCGLGLFPAAIVHLCFHGLFKSYLFLSSGSSAQEKRISLVGEGPCLKDLFLSIVCGAFGAMSFSLISGKSFLNGDTTIFLILISMIAGTQFAISIISSSSKFKFPIALISTLLIGSFYGIVTSFVEELMDPMGISYSKNISFIHIIAIIVMCVSWLFVMFSNSFKSDSYKNLFTKIYVSMLNASQPHPKTVTTHRNKYKF